MRRIDGYDYAVTRDGRIWSYKRHMFLKCQANLRGYIQVRLYHKDGSKNFTVHQLVARAFLPNPNKYLYVNHKDGDKHNNRVSNLEWCSAHANMHHALITGLLDSNIKLTPKQVLEIRDLHPDKSYTQLAKIYGVTKMNIACIVKRRSWTHI